ncbi:hypothetical protein C8Q70DRAFT_936676 [Cubamyces menziesii]|nr:hypothetical protein C8Q70DRAFT_936676 [Cubamyces menziesii]
MPPTRGKKHTASQRKTDEATNSVRQHNHVTQALASASLPVPKKPGRPKQLVYPEAEGEDLRNGITRFTYGKEPSSHACGHDVEVSNIANHFGIVHETRRHPKEKGKEEKPPVEGEHNSKEKVKKLSVKGKGRSAKKEEETITCQWVGCSTKMKASGVARHIRNCHIKTGIRTCLWCGRGARENEYYRDHGSATSCEERQRVLSMLINGSETTFLETIKVLHERGGSTEHISKFARQYLQDMADSAWRTHERSPAELFSLVPPGLSHFRKHYGVDLLAARYNGPYVLHVDGQPGPSDPSTSQNPFEDSMSAPFPELTAQGYYPPPTAPGYSPPTAPGYSPLTAPRCSSPTVPFPPSTVPFPPSTVPFPPPTVPSPWFTISSSPLTEDSVPSPGPLAYDSDSSTISSGPATPSFLPAVPLVTQPEANAPWSVPSTPRASQSYLQPSQYFPASHGGPMGPQCLPTDLSSSIQHEEAQPMWPTTGEGNAFGDILPDTQPVAQPFDYDSFVAWFS